MPANSPGEICKLFKQYMSQGDVDLLLSLYDPEAAFLNEAGEIKKGKEELRGQLAAPAAAKAIFEFDIRQIIESRDIALMHTKWQVSWPQPRSVYAIEVARRQPDGSWCWLIGDPFTVGKQTAA
ncbi:MAG TPA: nuclear transport factor 2 family protein [Terriglobales bacterium]|jgi:ketosteroid isomerase-like protein